MAAVRWYGAKETHAGHRAVPVLIQHVEDWLGDAPDASDLVCFKPVPPGDAQRSRISSEMVLLAATGYYNVRCASVLVCNVLRTSWCLEANCVEKKADDSLWVGTKCLQRHHGDCSLARLNDDHSIQTRPSAGPSLKFACGSPIALGKKIGQVCLVQFALPNQRIELRARWPAHSSQAEYPRARVAYSYHHRPAREPRMDGTNGQQRKGIFDHGHLCPAFRPLPTPTHGTPKSPCRLPRSRSLCFDGPRGASRTQVSLEVLQDGGKEPRSKYG